MPLALHLDGAARLCPHVGPSSSLVLRWGNGIWGRGNVLPKIFFLLLLFLALPSSHFLFFYLTKVLLLTGRSSLVSNETHRQRNYPKQNLSRNEPDHLRLQSATHPSRPTKTKSPLQLLPELSARCTWRGSVCEQGVVSVVPSLPKYWPTCTSYMPGTFLGTRDRAVDIKSFSCGAFNLEPI